MNSISIFNRTFFWFSFLFALVFGMTSLGYAKPTPADREYDNIILEIPAGDILDRAQNYFSERFQSDRRKTLANIREAISVLHRVGGIKRAEIREKDGNAIVYIEPNRTVASATVDGNKAISTKRIFKALSYSDNQITILQPVETYIQALENLYEREGFVGTNIEVGTQRIPKMQKVILVVKIEEGIPLYISPNESAAETLEKLNLSAGQRFKPKSLDASAERYRKDLVDQGYLSAAVKATHRVLSLEKGSVAIELTEELGPQFVIEFKTKQYFFQDRDSLLLDAIGFKGEKTFSRGFFEDALEKLTRYYKQYGYLFVDVKLNDSLSEDGTRRTVSFVIKKGPRVRLRKIEFHNNKLLDRSVLKSFLGDIEPGDAFDREKFAEAVSQFKAQMQELGFHDAFDASFTEKYSKDKKFVDTVIEVREGPRYRFGEVRWQIEGGISQSTLEDEVLFSSNDYFLLSKYQQSLEKMRRKCLNIGYKFCRIDVEPTIDDTTKFVELLFKVKTGEKIYIGNIFVVGNRITKEHVIRRELTIKRGDVFSPDDIETSQRAVQRLGFFLSVRVDEVGFNSVVRQADLVVRVRERKRRNIRFRVGAGSDEGLRTTVDFSFLNLGGVGRNLYLSTGVSREFRGELIEFRLTSNYIEPYLFGLPIDGRVQFSFEREEEEFGNIERLGYWMGVEYRRQEWFRNLFRWQLEFREPFSLKVPDEDLNDFDEARRFFGSLGTLTTFDLRDNPLNPTLGLLSRLNMDVYDTALLSEEEFYQVVARNTFYAPITEKVNLVLSVRFGFAGTRGSTRADGIESIPIEKRFRLGGSQSLRGFSLDSVGGLEDNEPALGSGPPAPGGNSMVNYLVEVGFPLVGDFRMVGFTDGGNAFATNRDFDITNLRYSAGVGLRYLTPVGPLRLDFGFKLDRKTGESLGELHFAVGSF